MQETTGDNEKSIGIRAERIKVCNITWKYLKKVVMKGDKNYKQLKIPLTDNEQLLLQRFIDAEKQEPDFIAKGLAENFQYEIFFYFYFAGHGCSNNRQYILLNERVVDLIFYPAEERIKAKLKMVGPNCKTLMVFDCCREAYLGAKERVIKALKKVEEEQQTISQNVNNEESSKDNKKVPAEKEEQKQIYVEQEHES